MKFTRILLFALFAGQLAMVSVFAGVQEEKKNPKEPTEASKAELQSAMDRLVKSLKEKSLNETKAMIDKIAIKFAGGDKAQKGKAVGLLKKCLSNKDKSIRNMAITSLGNTGGKALGVLMKGAKSSKKVPALQQRYLRAAGKLRDPKGVEQFIKYLNNKNNDTIKASIVALGYYATSETKIRKEIVKELLKQYSSIDSAFTRPVPTTTDKNRYHALRETFEATLRKLTKQELTGASAWARWFRKDGKKRKEW